jgi:DNA-binding transcriptional LysR family regulator
MQRRTMSWPRSGKRRRIDWDDLQYVLAVADAGSLAAAATALRVNRTTVLRRINAFERRQGVRLFDRLASGYVLTDAGDELLAAARTLEDTIVTLERKLAGQDQRLEGTLRLTTTDTLLASVLAAPLVAFREAHPGITLEISQSNAMLDLSKRDADVAIRPVVAPPESLMGRRIAPIAFAVYGSPSYLATDIAASELGNHRWIAPDDTLATTSVARWMQSRIKAAARVLRLDSLLAMRELCAAGGGLTALPCYLGDTDARLVRASEPIAEMATALWVLTHPDLAHTARIRLFNDFISSALKRERSLLAGGRPGL